MADLQELSRALESLEANGASAKVSFYYVDADGIAMRAGSILVDRGAHAYIDHRQLAPQAAVEAIRVLKLVKVASLHMDQVHPNPALVGVDLRMLIADMRVAPVTAAAAIAAPASPEPASRAAATTTEFPAVVQPHIDVAAEAERLLEPLFGVSARKKIDEFAKAHTPAEHPYEFLLMCQKHASIMLGAAKAEAMFRPLYDRIASDQLQRRR